MEATYHATSGDRVRVITKEGKRGGLRVMCFSKLRAPKVRGELISCDLESDKRLRLGRGDCDDLADITGCCTCSVCDDGTDLIRPTG